MNQKVNDMIFSIFKRKKKNTDSSELSESNLKWNKMWELWANGEIESPYNELMTYHSEVNNGGHSQYFSLITDNCDVESEFDKICGILPDLLKENVHKGYQAHLILESDDSDENANSVIRKCDELFFDNEYLITEILESFAELIG